MGNEKYQRTVREVRDLLRPAAHPPRVYGPVRRRATFGATKRAVSRNLRSVTFCGREVAVHRKIVPSLKRVEARIRRAEARNDWDKWVPERLDCFNWRPIRGGTALSRHAHAIALDIDPKDNLMTAHYDGKDKTTIPVRVVQAFIDDGWTWGGNWGAPCDPMHFQYC